MASIFSKIIAGDIPGSFVFTDQLWVGLLDLAPVSPGHLLIIPRVEAPLLADLPADTLAAMGPTVARGTACLKAIVQCDAVVLLRDGSAAGQEVPHVHIHPIPRYTGDQPHDFRGGSYGSANEEPATAMSAMATN